MVKINKVCTLKEAVSKYVESGDTLALGGFTTNRKPYAAVHEILRQEKGEFIAEAGAAGGDWDLLIGAGRVKVYINCYTANPRFSNVSRRFREKVESGELLFEDYSQDVSVMRFHTAAIGLPFTPVYFMKGSSLYTEWGISEEVRKTLDKVPDKKFVTIDNPFVEGEKIVLVPSPKVDTAILHVQMASPDGTCRILGSKFNDVDLSIIAKKTIVTCEELVSDEFIRREPEMNSIPGFCVDAVVHIPYGAHPSQCFDYYDYDVENFLEYEEKSKTQEGFDEFIEKYILSTKDQEEYLKNIGVDRLLEIKVNPDLGFATKRVQN